MAGSSITTTVTELPSTVTNKRYKLIQIDWVSDDTTGSVALSTDQKFTGKIYQFATVPSGGGTAPTDQYDITLLDSRSIDMLGASGANRSGTSVEIKTAISAGQDLGFVFNSVLTLTVDNAGNSNEGTVYVFLEE